MLSSCSESAGVAQMVFSVGFEALAQSKLAAWAGTQARAARPRASAREIRLRIDAGMRCAPA